jgi:hypothetical protein
VTRTHKFNDRDHRAEAEGVPHQAFLPKYFGKNGFGGDPNRFKKNGGGRANWGNVGEELADQGNFHLFHGRRRSNGNVLDLSEFMTKFDVNDPEPMYDQNLHGPVVESEADALDEHADGAELAKSETASTTSSAP